MLMNGNGSTGNKLNIGYLKLPILPKDENMFSIWKLKVEAMIRGAGLIEVLENDQIKLRALTLERMKLYQSQRETEEAKAETEIKELTQEQKDILMNKGYRVYAALAETLITADQIRILLNKSNVPDGDANRLWNAIKERYDVRTTDATKERLWEIFNGLKMISSEDFKMYKGRVEEAAANLYTVGETVPDSRMKAKLITGLSKRYSSFVGGLYTGDYSSIRIVDLCKRINDFEETTVFKTTMEEETDSELASYLGEDKKYKFGKGKFKDNKYKFDKSKFGKDEDGKPHRKCFTCNKPGHISYECYSNKNKKKCSRCKKIGHSDSECYFNKSKKVESREKENKEDETSEYNNFFGSVIENNIAAPVITPEINTNTWLLDSGASRHMCVNKDAISDLHKADKVITMNCANRQPSRLTQIGAVKLQIMSGQRKSKITLTDVVYAPNFQCNLISVGRLIKANAKVVFGEKGAVVFANGKPVIAAKKVGNLFVVCVVNKEVNHEPSETSSNISSAVVEQNNQVTDAEKKSNVELRDDDEAKLWHHRLGHLGYDGINKLIVSKSVDGLELSSKLNEKHMREVKCDSCIKGKQHRQPFNKGWSDKAKKILDRVHADLCGPVQPSRTGTLYLSTIIDEYSRMIFGETIMHKSDTEEIVITYCNRVKTSLGRPVIEFHTDGGGEYKSSKLVSYFKEQGINHTTTLPETPQHNPIAERANRTIFESARAMLVHSKLPKEFWSDAVLYAIHIRNRCITTVDKQKTPYELWTGKKPSVSHIRTFGCDAFMHIKKSARKKLDDKSIECVMIGYSDYNRGYKLFCNKNKKVYYSRDVIFKENEFKHGALITSNVDKPQDTSLRSKNYFDPLNDDVKQMTHNILDGIEERSDSVGVDEYSDSEDENDIEKAPTNLSNVAERKEEQVGDEQKEEEEEEEKSEAPEPVDLSSLPRELRGLAAGSQYALFAPPTSRVRSVRTVDRGPVITDRRQMNDYSQAVIETDYDEEVEDEYCFMTSVDEPSSYAEALSSRHSDQWKEATNKEYKSLIENDTWEVCKLPNGRTPIGCKWVYKIKINKEGEVERYKARLVAKGYSQKEGIDYNETFAPVLKYKSLRILLSLAAINDFEVKQMDVETAFLNAPIKEEVYMEQPEGYHDGNRNNVLRLKKTLYGTKQAPHEWNNTLNDVIVSLKFTRCVSDTCTYIRYSQSNKPIIIAVFVDDLIITYHITDEEEWLECKDKLSNSFKMKDLNNAEWILGIRITRDRTLKTIKLDHEVQINKTLSTFRMGDCKPVGTPAEIRKLSKADCPKTQQEYEEMSHVPYKSVVGSLQYIALSTRPDIAYAVNQLSRYLSNPGHNHWLASKRVLRYLKGTSRMSLLYKNYDGHASSVIEVFCDADWAGDLDDRKSTTGIVIKLNGCPVLWLSKKQSTTALSTAEAEYIAIAAAGQELIWMNQYLSELGLIDKQIPIIRSDNQAAIQIASNDRLHSRSKHIDIRYHFIRQMIQEGRVRIVYVSTTDQEADINTKSLDMRTFKRLRDRLLSRD